MDTRARTNRLWRHALGYSAPLLLWNSVHAAEPQAATGGIIEEVQVTGIRQSLRDALSVKLNSDLVVDAISSEDIGQLPDVTIAESINRLPGINATRDRGNDSQAVVRGLGARLVLGTINGREVASSEPDRNVRWEIYPSEVVSGVKVYKTQSADLIAGGVAATIDIQTLQPLDYEGADFVVRGGPVYYDEGADIPDYDPWGYRASGSYVLKASDTFGLVIGLTAQQQKNGYSSFTGWGYNDSLARPPEGASDFTGDLDGDGNPDATPWGAQVSVNGIDQDRRGVSLGTQWRPSDQFELRFDALYSDVDIHEDQGQTVYGQNNWGNWDNGSWAAYNAPGASYTIVDGTVVAATLPFSSVTTVVSDYDENKELSVMGLNGRWSGERWSVTGDLSYSQAERENIWKAVRTEVYPEWMTWDTRGGRLPTIATSVDPTTLTQFAPDYRGGSVDGPEHLDDELTAGALDFARSLDGSFLSSMQFGARLSSRTKQHDRMENYPSAPAGGVEIPASLFRVYNVPSVNLPPVLLGDYDEIARLAYGAALDPSNAEENLSQRWKVEEEVAEGYLKLNFTSTAIARRMTGNIGVRLLDVQTTSDGYQQATGASELTPVSVEHDYNELLPSANVNFNLTDTTLLRFGAAKVVARPPLDELRASRTLTNWLPFTGNAGNPNLEPFEATQFDASYEWYFRDEALLGFAAYYKDVSSYIGWRQDPQTFEGITYAVATPVNGDGGAITGAEFTFQTPFFFWSALENFGVYSNYAYVDSDVEEFVPITNPLTGTGFARHTAVFDLWYSSGPIEARLGYKYHSPFTVIYGWNGADLQTLEEESVLDLSTSYQLTTGIQLRFQVNNLTDEPLRMHRDNQVNRIGRYDEYGRRYLVDVTMKF
ncbi:TonB-dependent receptor [Steroidobacter agaridevorans]|uniref:TonB-dependent receptor n=1 Tax=Steroidobacter agaridevorans TaxID=2695856 RepID=A0A829YIY3_9GAMM|nr:TonB-dependent receptor [Steroidobacter agaridevorans]GFE83247.1 TonB-dependent receptor [Steroidobacter agaridevorans]